MMLDYTKKKWWWLLGMVPVAFLGFISIDQTEKVGGVRGTDIESTRGEQVCRSFSGQGVTEQGEVYLDSTDGDRYFLKPERLTSRRQLTETQQKLLLASFIEQKFCLQAGQVLIDIADEKFTNITIRNDL